MNVQLKWRMVPVLAALAVALGGLVASGLAEAAPPVCGDNVRAGGEACDGTDDASCPGQCQVDCTCPAPLELQEADVVFRYSEFPIQGGQVISPAGQMTLVASLVLPAGKYVLDSFVLAIANEAIGGVAGQTVVAVCEMFGEVPQEPPLGSLDEFEVDANVTLTVTAPGGKGGVAAMSLPAVADFSAQGEVGLFCGSSGGDPPILLSNIGLIATSVSEVNLITELVPVLGFSAP